MENPITKWNEKVKNFWQQGTTPQKILAIGALISVTLVFIMLLIWLNQEEYAVLYSNLKQQDSASVVEYLKKQNIDYKLKDNGSTILIPKNKVYDVRLEIAGQEILGKGNVGFDIFSKNSIGQTDFVQRINYQRALQGELSATISAIPEIQHARVHLVLPKKSLFVEEETEASASILVELKRGKELTKEQIRSIVNLVATAVEGLSKENITVVDNRGKLLYRSTKDEQELGLSSTQLEYKLNLEKSLARKIENLLYPVVGAGKVLAQVNVELDLSEQNIYKESYDPDTAVIRSEQRVKETSRGTAQAEASKAGPQYQQQGGGTQTSEETARTQETINYEISKQEQRVRIPKGQLSKVTVAVLVDGVYKKGKDGKLVYEPRPDAELDKIKDIVKSAVGFDPKRGDIVEVASMQFTPIEIAEPSFWQILLDYLHKFIKPILNTVVLLAFLLLVIRPVVLSVIKPKVEEETAEMEALEEAEETQVPQLSEEELAALEAKRPFEEIKQKAATILDKYPDDAVTIIKGWVREDAKK